MSRELSKLSDDFSLFLGFMTSFWLQIRKFEVFLKPVLSVSRASVSSRLFEAHFAVGSITSLSISKFSLLFFSSDFPEGKTLLSFPSCWFLSRVMKGSISMRFWQVKLPGKLMHCSDSKEKFSVFWLKMSKMFQPWTCRYHVSTLYAYQQFFCFDAYKKFSGTRPDELDPGLNSSTLECTLRNENPNSID